jgi:Mg-chelatase subunit ChlD
MEGENLRLSKDFIRNLVARLPERDKKALVSFSTTAKVESPFSVDSGAVIRALDPIQSLGGSAVYDGIRAAMELLASSDLRLFRKSILVITDGQDKNSESTLQGLIDSLNTKLVQYDVNLIIVGIERDEIDFSDLEKIARAANGLFRAAPITRLPTVLQEVQRNL